MLGGSAACRNRKHIIARGFALHTNTVDDLNLTNANFSWFRNLYTSAITNNTMIASFVQLLQTGDD